MVTGRFNVRNRGGDSDMIHAEFTCSDRGDTRVGLLSDRVHRQYSKITAMKRIPIP